MAYLLEYNLQYRIEQNGQGFFRVSYQLNNGPCILVREPSPLYVGRGKLPEPPVKLFTTEQEILDYLKGVIRQKEAEDAANRWVEYKKGWL